MRMPDTPRIRPVAKVEQAAPHPPVSLDQSFQNFLNRSGAISVYRTVCMMFLWPM
jgi:hypothetical protein